MLRVVLSDGNSFAIYAACDRAMREAQWSGLDRWKFQRAFFLCANQTEVLALVMERFQVELLVPVEIGDA
jgi:hypothetical protein